MIFLKKICYSYPGGRKNEQHEVLQDISLNINSGEFVTILGRSGCGKTTLVNILASFITTNKGELLIDGKVATKPARNRIVVNQENDSFEWMTVWENMKLVTDDERSIAKYLKLVGLDKVQNRYPHKLSGGMKKRLSLARALSVNPEFLILDEPFASLDYITQQGLITELDMLFSVTKKTTLLVTHNIEEAIYLSDRVIILGGRPATIRNEIRINFDHPRKIEIKDTKKYIDYLKRIKDSYL